MQDELPGYTLARELRAIQETHSWCGFLTEANAEAIANRIRKCLEGTYYAIVQWHEGFAQPGMIEVHTSNWFDEVTFDSTDGRTWIHIRDDSSWSWSWTTTFPNVRAACAAGKEHYNAVWFDFDGSRFEVTAKSPSGHTHMHIFTPELHEYADDE